MGSMKLFFKFLWRLSELSLHNCDRVIIQFKWDESSCDMDEVTSSSDVNLSSNVATY